ncbi:nucleoside-diphosphate kinase [candidate division WOR-1 bacterium RIFOXYA12_FULL_52_29]|uniref:Nucleoside diphosphate kinase n=1 Tax=candidate division WOR-1 bacterium RIFOXYC12_FULL_54_18 TaxID=1802584 RepID=A0A1F4T800_UNCSA|nr:MAG: nucleoside-diphosphate kinase [candidate division WOR-1 bacterium RIFOXYA2_FULL_51_19]OGC18212.1 MAG: nucleoside-diphosphate kinase [candidate division WOR-1 bacterium RIFOXYA12_FULL_52_29]OGC27067.1 MAG: nucleoside-diphosphate kinase [candidate division WOR-1 bacterium RIFOXYB2_FULL_45_9]OGC28629.1 MAG: nucleoside-diphosphate kinase [candidate division WOR-1 bacterium RIFOXYC12_FULL_54_18]OGC30916.1 MAG: nucleoside-diphosphate kinase [candidate division WOR-1 bacterium RIFOXYB12_FULL_5
MVEKTFFMIKPDGVARGLATEIIKRVDLAGLRTAKSEEVSISRKQAELLYAPHLGKSFYPGLINFITSGPVVVNIVEGENAISRVRLLMGDTDPLAAERGTIRGDLKEAEVINHEGIIKNLVHGSDSPSSASRELAIFFPGS